MDTQLAGDNAPSDFLSIAGNASGRTFVSIFNLGGNGALTVGNGIPIIRVEGNNPQSAFSLAPDGLNHMWVGADNYISAMFKQVGGQFSLLGVFPALVFISPVHGDNDHIRFSGPRFLKVLLDLYCVDPVHNHGWGHLQPVCAVCIIQECDPDPFFLEDKIIMINTSKTIPAITITDLPDRVVLGRFTVP